ncbi:hypothetical protein GCM10023206_07050 [Acinetobacter puyangensis]|uniref:Uncharacterized protein n=1 Tax=Acinetobacter puyangensis TaxID=1096779 RepID=A0A240E8I0_9GAMM|nr:hypothetical protein [Acinetobacter puyangensis]SNX44215.1 hypothetical protein SAMN05421731_102376 [Acinetobacter puyangensis]
MTDFIRIDARVVGFANEPVRILGLCFKDTGELLIEKLEKFSTLPVLEEYRQTTIVVTDAPELVKSWHLSFNAKEDLETVISVYQMRMRSKLVEIAKNLNRFDPGNILQVRKVDKNGIQQEFDSSSLDNGHVATLLAVWASSQVAFNYSAFEAKTVSEDVDNSMLPFSC